MSILGQYKEQNNLNTSNNDKQSITINMPVKITGYEDEYFIGQRLDKKEMVKVKFRPVEVKGENARPEVEHFSNKRHKRYAKPGESILLFDNTYKEEDGTFNARWANTLTNQKIKASVVVLPSHVGIYEGSDFSSVYINSLKKSSPANSLDELNATLLECFTPRVHKARSSAIIRMKDSDNNYQIISAMPHLIEMEEDGDKYKLMDNPQNSLDNFYNNHKYAQMVKDLIVNPEVEVDVISMGTIYAGGDTSQRILSNDRERKWYKESYSVENSEEIGYKKTVIALRERGDGSMFASFIKPLVNGTQATSINTIKV